MSALRFTVKTFPDASTAKTACAIVPVATPKTLSAAARQLDEASNGIISATLKLGDFNCKPGETALLTGTDQVKRILLVGTGKDALDRKGARELISGIYTALNTIQSKDAILHLADLNLDKADREWFLEALARHITSASYRYKRTITKPKSALNVSKLTIDPGKLLSARNAQKALDQGNATGLGMATACDLANLPGNICTPTYLADHAKKMGREFDMLSVRIVDEKKMKELGMGALLSVSAGSDEPAKLIVMEYKGSKSAKKPYVLVGKGITFDTGGISLKPGAKMDEMKYDMGGAASVIGTMEAIATLKLPLHVIGIVAAAENMPSGRATKPGDVVTSMSGQTIEVLNTDAEGRLVLCDALTYAERFKPQAVIDIATLTGACVVALGEHATGLYANNEKLAEQLLTAGTESHDRAWRMPLWDDYQRQINTSYADIANIGGPGGGSITAACFLARFTEKYHWAHMDIAGTAWSSSPKAATGRPVPLLTRFLIDRVGK